MELNAISLIKPRLITASLYNNGFVRKSPNSPSVFSGVRVTRSFGFYVMFCRSLFLHFLLAILRFTASNCSFGIVKLFSHYIGLFCVHLEFIPRMKNWISITLLDTHLKPEGELGDLRVKTILYRFEVVNLGLVKVYGV